MLTWRNFLLSHEKLKLWLQGERGGTCLLVRGGISGFAAKCTQGRWRYLQDKIIKYKSSPCYCRDWMAKKKLHFLITLISGWFMHPGKLVFLLMVPIKTQILRPILSLSQGKCMICWWMYDHDSFGRWRRRENVLWAEYSYFSISSPSCLLFLS